ncbi:MAG: SEC59/DGK1/VTE5 family protein [Treponema sp.]|jgi:dolichol kinase|nr:SEC59/DGK1/VTE5 family protein [Treponema sp.]
MENQVRDPQCRDPGKQDSPEQFPNRRLSEVVRKAFHFLIALAPVLAQYHKTYTLALLAGGTAAYAVMETLRRRGFRIPLVSSLTVFASRRRDRGRFVLGPVTLGMGAFLTLVLFPPVAAAAGVYALAFGDGTASLAGKFSGRLRLPFLFGKSLEGSLACFLGAFISAYLVSQPLGNRWHIALIAACTATAAELLPIRDWDNIIIPLATASAVQLFS